VRVPDCARDCRRADVFKANLVSTATLRGLVESSVRDALRITDPLHIRSLLTAVSFLEKYDFDSGGEITKLRSVFSEVRARASWRCHLAGLMLCTCAVRCVGS
jgi:hypothetical protein